MPVYTLKEFEELDHLHVFEAKISQTNPEIRCQAASTSCCGKIKRAEYKEKQNAFACLDEKAALLSCINSDKQICAACEAHLFKKYQELHRQY